MVGKVDCNVKSAYFNYLVELVCDREHHKVDYIPLLDKLHNMKFVYSIDMDSNRASDGRDFRGKFLDEEGLDSEYMYEFDGMDVSALEVLIGLASRISSQIDNAMFASRFKEHFWELLDNLDVSKYTADNYKAVNIDEKIRIWMDRRFEKDGKGSPFPLRKPENDQRKREIWVQMSDYIWENFC